MMPNIPNTAHLGLSTKRERSSIPKTGEGKTWVYPSSAQFFRALQRRGKEAEKETMPAVVHVHNFVNEETWQRITTLEQNHPECAQVTLTRFCGRSDDLTVTARVMNRLGWWGQLFDRHDWYLDRCGQQVRYIIDYYDDPKAENIAEVYIHARPAPFDSLENFRDMLTHTVQALWRGERP
ncbi:putative cytochrome c1 heme lyase [Cyclospora cayetanensis]|uniref:Holocytochrome c-type synthase n=1 Tax=Cyclospora cayetanensis TaxID=88456 RepID=A0A6P5WDM1_9EIME|nr:putative cytochrome c1 heme lyase [Cyclospora cayetanensis]